MYWFIKIITYPFIRLFFPCRIKNRKNFVKGGAVLVCNHLSNLDVMYFGSYIHRRLFFLGKKELLNKKLSAWFFKKCGMIPIDRENIDLNAIKTSLGVLKKGKYLVVFPEGTRNKTDENLHAIKNGAVMLALKAGVPVIPMNIKQKGKLFCFNRVIVGNPITFEEFKNQRLNTEVLNEAGKILEQKLLELYEKKSEKNIEVLDNNK